MFQFLRQAALFGILLVGTSAAAHAQLFASLAPEARTARTGGEPATFFISAINSGSETLTDCRPAGEFFPEADFSYQTVDAANNLTGTVNTPVEIAAGQTQGFLVVYSPPASGWVGAVTPRVLCHERDSEYAPYLAGYLSIPSTGERLPDLVAISATPSGDGVIRMNRAGGRGAMAVAAVNIGAAGDVRLTPSDAYFMQGLASFTICETDETAQCLAPATSSLTVTFAENQVRTFAVFARGQREAGIPFYPDFLRVRLNMTDPAGGWEVGRTSAAFTAPPPESEPPASGVYTVLYEEPFSTRGGAVTRIEQGLLGILPDGEFFLWGDGGLFTARNEWISHGRAPVNGNRIHAPRSFIHIDGDDQLAILDWNLNLSRGTGVVGQYRPSQIQFGDPYLTVQGRGRVRGVWLGALNTRPTTVADLQGAWYVVTGNRIVGTFDIAADGTMSNGRFNLSGYTNCRFFGAFRQPDPAVNIFSVTLDFGSYAAVNCAAPFNGNAFTGFATIDVLTEGDVPSGGSMPAILSDIEGSQNAGFSFRFVKA